MAKLKVAVGPISSLRGGLGGVSKNIVKFSKHNTEIFRAPFHLSFYKKLVNQITFENHMRLREKIWFDDPYSLYLAKVWLKKFDVIQMMGAPGHPGVFSEIGKSNSKYVYRIPGFYYIQGAKRFGSMYLSKKIDALMVKFCRKADAIVVTTPWYVSFLKKRYNLNSHLIGNSVDTKLWDSGKASRFENKFGIESGFCLYAASLTPVKNPCMFVEIARSFPNKRFVMIGTGVEEKAVRDFCNSNLPDNLFLLGRLGGEDLLDAFKASHILFDDRPGIWGGNNVMEAMASSTIPVRAYHSSYPNDDFFFVNGKEGFLFEHGNFQDCKKMMNRAWMEREMGKRSKNLAQKRHDWSEGILKYDNLYSSLV